MEMHTTPNPACAAAAPVATVVSLVRHHGSTVDAPAAGEGRGAAGSAA
ncbi:hypothetical protein [Brachybacterium sp. FME24]|nr:hypothetical protein [Brachybacterium sp. FME24]